MKKNLFITLILLISILNNFYLLPVYANSQHGLQEGDIATLKAEMIENIDKFAYDKFTLTHYSPLDSALDSDADSVKRLGSTTSSVSEYSPVQWYKEGNRWIFSAATTYRQDVAKHVFKDQFESKWELRELNVDNDSNKKVYEIVFPSGVEIPLADRKKVLPLSCKGRGMNYSGSPWSGSGGKIPQTGMIAADPDILKQGASLVIETYGKGLVGDVGGAIKGHRLDLVVNNCEMALSRGKKEDMLVAFDKSLANISGSPLTEEIIDKILAQGVFNNESNNQIVIDNMDPEDRKIAIKSYEELFSIGEININNVGVDDRKDSYSKVDDYFMHKSISKVALFFLNIAQIFSIFLVGLLAIYWLLAAMSFSDIAIANELLYKISFNKIDVHNGGFKKLTIFTIFIFIIIVLLMTNMIPKLVALVYSMLADITEFLSNISFFK